MSEITWTVPDEDLSAFPMTSEPFAAELLTHGGGHQEVRAGPAVVRGGATRRFDPPSLVTPSRDGVTP
jgi:hypothetical protein